MHLIRHLPTSFVPLFLFVVVVNLWIPANIIESAFVGFMGPPHAVSRVILRFQST